jgi:hypothetical protein
MEQPPILNQQRDKYIQDLKEMNRINSRHWMTSSDFSVFLAPQSEKYEEAHIVKI